MNDILILIYKTKSKKIDNMKKSIIITNGDEHKVARTEKDMTQKVLAEAVAVSRQAINAIEKGEYNPTIKLCRKICGGMVWQEHKKKSNYC